MRGSSPQSPNTKGSLLVSRRSLLSLPATLIPATSILANPSIAASSSTCPPFAKDGSSTLSALFDENATVKNLGVSWVPGPTGKQVYYPTWLEGEWIFSDAKLLNVSNPFGLRVVSRVTPGVTKFSMIAALPDVGASLKDTPLFFRQRFIRDPLAKDAATAPIVADRPFNIAALVSGFMGSPLVESIAYDPAVNATRLSIVYRTPRRDRPGSYDMRKAEIFLNNRAAECSGPDSDSFTVIENIRQVDQASRSGYTYDYANVVRYRRLDAGTVEVRQRAAAFANPQDPLFFETGDKAIALYDYVYTARRV